MFDTVFLSLINLINVFAGCIGYDVILDQGFDSDNVYSHFNVVHTYK